MGVSRCGDLVAARFCSKPRLEWAVANVAAWTVAPWRATTEVTAVTAAWLDCTAPETRTGIHVVRPDRRSASRVVGTTTTASTSPRRRASTPAARVVYGWVVNPG